MRSTKPDIGHLVHTRGRAGLAYDIGTATPALVVHKRGIEIQVLLPTGRFSWIQRDLVEVISESR